MLNICFDPKLLVRSLGGFIMYIGLQGSCPTKPYRLQDPPNALYRLGNSSYLNRQGSLLERPRLYDIRHALSSLNVARFSVIKSASVHCDLNFEKYDP
jgi:hypothetical protein